MAEACQMVAIERCQKNAGIRGGFEITSANDADSESLWSP
jgi:hypothetical protein